MKFLINNCTRLNDNSKNIKEKNERRKLDLSLNYHQENQTFHALKKVNNWIVMWLTTLHQY